MSDKVKIQQEVKKIIKLLVEKNYEHLADDNMLGELSGEEVKLAIQEYGEEITLPPDIENMNMDIFQIKKDGFPKEYSIDCDLWINNQRSDLTLSCEAKIFENGTSMVNIYSIHVL